MLESQLYAYHFETNIDEGVGIIHAIRQEDKEKKMNNLRRHMSDEVEHYAALDTLINFEHVDDDVMESHLLFEDYNNLFEQSLENSVVEEELIADIDEISI